MKLMTLMAAVLLTAAPVRAQETPSYAKVIAYAICQRMDEGMSTDKAADAAIRQLWPVFGADIKRDGVQRAANYVVAERLILCGTKK